MRRLRDAGEQVLVEATYRPRTGQNGRVWDNWYIERAHATGEPQGEPQTASSSSWDEPTPRPQRRAQQASASSGSGYRGKSPEERWEIALSVGAKLAVDTLPLLDEDQRDPESQWRLALFWATRIHTTPLPSAGAPVPPPSYESPQPAPARTGAYSEPESAPVPTYEPAYPDDDIPFD